jgi:hypothetical protein
MNVEQWNIMCSRGGCEQMVASALPYMWLQIDRRLRGRLCLRSALGPSSNVTSTNRLALRYGHCWSLCGKLHARPRARETYVEASCCGTSPALVCTKNSGCGRNKCSFPAPNHLFGSETKKSNYNEEKASNPRTLR